MICVGITGSYASGKTFVLDYLAGLGYETFSADKFIKELYRNPEIQNRILSILPQLKSFDTANIAELIYNSDSARNDLQSFIHPFVVSGLSRFKQQNGEMDITFAEIPLLFEAGFDRYFDFCVAVFCSEKTRFKRAESRNTFNLKAYNKIKQIQLSPKIKMEKADFVINTDLDTVKQVTQLIKKLK